MLRQLIQAFKSYTDDEGWARNDEKVFNPLKIQNKTENLRENEFYSSWVYKLSQIFYRRRAGAV